MRPITHEEIKNAWALMMDSIKQELMNKAVNSVFKEDTYTVWQMLINKPYKGSECPTTEETTVRALAILILEIKRLIRDRKAIRVNLMIDGDTYFETAFIPIEIRITEKSMLLCGSAATETTIEITWEHMEDVMLDTAVTGFSIKAIGEKSCLWLFDWEGFPIETV